MPELSVVMRNLAKCKSQHQSSSYLRRILVFTLGIVLCNIVGNTATKPDMYSAALTYRDLVEKGGVFVDKSFLIRDFIDINASAIRLTLPRHWGKTINTDMLKTFLAMEVDRDGNQYRASDTFAYRFFSSYLQSTKAIKFKIADHKDVMNNFCGQYPVIVFTFKYPGKSLTFESVLASVKDVLAEIFTAHVYMLNKWKEKEEDEFLPYAVQQLAKMNRRKFLKYFRKQGDEAETASSLKFLSQALSEYFEKKPYIFFDEYDTVLNEIFSNSHVNVKEKEGIFRFMHSFLAESLEHNKFYKKALITGMLKISFPGLNHLVEFNMLNNPFFTHYGFLQSEVDLLLQSQEQEVRKFVKLWYDGYTVKGHHDVGLYHPRSISNFLSAKTVRSYWDQSGPFQHFEHLFQPNTLNTSIFRILSGESRQLDLRGLTFTTKDLVNLQDISDENRDLNGHYVDMFYRLCFSAGYFTIDSQKTDAIRIPNEEVATEISESIMNHYLHMYGIEPSAKEPMRAEFKKLLRNNGTDSFKIALETFFNRFPVFSIMREIHDGGYLYHCRCVEDAVQPALNIVILLSQTATQEGSEICLSTRPFAYIKQQVDIACVLGDCPNIAIIVPELQLGIIVEFTFWGWVTDALGRALKYSSMFENRTDVQFIRLLGVQVQFDKTVRIDEYTVKKKDKPWLSTLMDVGYFEYKKHQALR